MLVLTRHPSEKLRLRNNQTGDEIWITCVSVRGAATRIGIDAGREWDIARQEIIKPPTRIDEREHD